MVRERFALCVLAVLLPAWECQGQVADLPNLAPNGGFERGLGDQPEAWRFYSWQASEGWWDAEIARSGARSLGLRGANGGWFSQLPVERGLVYSLDLHYRAQGAPVTLALFVRTITDGRVGEAILYKTVRLGLLEATGSWVRLEGGDFIPGVGCTTVDLLIKIEGGAPGSEVWLDDLTVTARAPRAAPLTARRLADLPAGIVWTDVENAKITPTQSPPEGPSDPAISVSAARGEYECFQVAITLNAAWQQVDWSWSTLSGPTELPPEAMTCRLIECIPITRAHGPYGEVGPQPDALTSRLPVDVASGTTQGFWFTVHVPAQQAAGLYTSELMLRCEGREVARFPVSVTVRSFSIPPRPSLGVYSSFRYYLVLPRETGEPAEVIERYYRGFFAHRTSCPPAAPVGVRLQGDTVEVDLAEYLRHEKHLRDAYGLERVDAPSLWIDHRGTHRLPADAEWQGIPIFADANLTTLNPAFERPFRAYFRMVCATLRQEGLFLRPVVRFFDEPDLEDIATRNGLRTLAKLILDIDPEVTVSIAASDPVPELTDAIRLWIIHTDMWDRALPHIEAARRAGCQIHVYNNAVNQPDHRRLRVRLWPWLLWQYRVDGTYSWWGTVCWRGDMENPWTAGTGDFSGVLLYPPRTADERGPVESVRWELFREGLEDYEYLALADRLAARLEAAGRPEAARAARQAIDNATALVERWPNVQACNDESYAIDPAKVAAAREALAEAIEGMQGAGE